MKQPNPETASAECALLLARGRLNYFRNNLDKYASRIPSTLMEIQKLEEALSNYNKKQK